MPRGNTINKPVKNVYPNRDKYVSVAQNQTNPKFCHRMGNNPKPWLTLVMGSGCTTSSDQEAALFQRAKQFVGYPVPKKVNPSDLDRAIPSDVEGQPIGQAVAEFATDLIRDRLRVKEFDAGKNLGSDGLPGAASGKDIVPEWMFPLFVVALLSTKLYYRIKSHVFAAPRRADRSDDAVLGAETRMWGSLTKGFVTPCIKVITALTENEYAAVREGWKTSEDFERAKATLEHILSKIQKGLTPVGNPQSIRVSLEAVRALAEFAWFCFTEPVTPKVYPGWSDLLLYLSSYTPAESIPGVPLFRSLTDAQILIETRYTDVTEDSWRKLRRDNGPSGGLHYRAATMLNAQYEHGQRKRLTPPTTAFITSFDLELELALLHQGKAFTLAFPIHVSAGPVAHMCWITLQVPKREPGTNPTREDLNRLINPPSSYWKVLEPYPEGPLVIRLAGCPLVKLPENFYKFAEDKNASDFAGEFFSRIHRFLHADAGDAPDKKKDDALRKRLVLQHAVMINEHDAITQSAIDLIQSSESPGRSERESFRGLHADFAASIVESSRFWMLLGVQIQDNAVRHRITTLISSLPALEPAGQMAPENDSGSAVDGVSTVMQNGLAVNRNLSPLEKDLLFWNGFDIVEGDINDFADDLAHYTVHLEKDEYPSPTKVCKLDHQHAAD
jgi:hypothetical protein